MPISLDHYTAVREHFKFLLGHECAHCGTSFNLEFHHITPSLRGEGRGRDVRMWDWFDQYREANLLLLCHDCHCELHNNEGNKDER